jgi:hypothetical protein
VSQDRPSAPELIRTVRDFLAGLRPKLEGAEQYNTLVASYVLGIVEREITLAPALDRQERDELAAFLDASGTLSELQRRLSENIRAGRHDDDWQRVLELVLRQVVNKVRVVRPDSLDPIHSQSHDEGGRK